MKKKIKFSMIISLSIMLCVSIFSQPALANSSYPFETTAQKSQSSIKTIFEVSYSEDTRDAYFDVKTDITTNKGKGVYSYFLNYEALAQNNGSIMREQPSTMVSSNKGYSVGIPFSIQYSVPESDNLYDIYLTKCKLYDVQWKCIMGVGWTGVKDIGIPTTKFTPIFTERIPLKTLHDIQKNKKKVKIGSTKLDYCVYYNTSMFSSQYYLISVTYDIYLDYKNNTGIFINSSSTTAKNISGWDYDSYTRH